MNRAIALLLVFGASVASASDGLSEGVARLAANMNEAALACSHMSTPEVKQAIAKQKAAAIADMKIAEADYDKVYEASAKEFRAKWASMPKDQQASMCEQMQKMSK